MAGDKNNFGLIGVAGYVSPRHLKAIKDTNNRLVAALDKSDSVGILDSFFPNAVFFTEFERFDRYLEMLRRKEPKTLSNMSPFVHQIIFTMHIAASLFVSVLTPFAKSR